MKISESWLREWVNPELDSQALVQRLTMLGLEVDSASPVAGDFDKVVVGEVLAVEPHPDADRLSLCRVNTGAGKPLHIVCGAANVRPGERYPTALVGAGLPGGLKIRKNKIRGQTSEGMLCSAVELGLADSADGILELGDAFEPGADVRMALDLDDIVIDIDLTPNRADCFSVLGIARDLAADSGLPFEGPDVAEMVNTVNDQFSIELADPSSCPRFAGRVIRSINPDAQTPLWMLERLRRSGVRPIHPVVDVTNYVMLELGQPMHAYDLERLDKKIIVRRAVDGEKLTLLDGQEVTADPEVLVIADESGAIGLAGIMGGESTAVSEKTTHIFLESAFFDPDVIVGRARRFGLHTDASMRFERGVDPVHQARAVQRATDLLLQITGGEPGPVVEQIEASKLPECRPVELRRERLSRVLGLEIPDKQVESILTGLNMSVEATDLGWAVTPGSARFDIAVEVDLIEEIVRLYGYDRIPEKTGAMPATLGTVTESLLPLSRARDVLVDRGYREAITYSFIDEKLARLFEPDTSRLTLSNPISSELSVMRPSLWPGLMQALRHNLSRQQARVRLFESGVRFFPQGTDILEEEHLAGIAAGSLEPEQWNGVDRSVNLFDIKADLDGIFSLTGLSGKFSFRAAEHPVLRPGRCAQIYCDDRPAGWLGEIHPAVAGAMDISVSPVVFEISLAEALVAHKPAFSGVSKFPAVRRDISVVIDSEVPVASLERSVREAAGDVLRETVIFDVYQGKNVETGSKSVALGLILQDTSRTLTDADIDGVLQAVLKRLTCDFNATIRE